MAERPKGYGMTADLEAKKAAKYDPEQAEMVFHWISLITDEEGATLSKHDQKSVHEALKDGVILCKLMNTLLTLTDSSLTPIKINIGTKMAFKQMENISKFLDYCTKLGCASSDVFQTADLYDGTNISQVINGIFALGRKIGTNFPDYGIGPKESTMNKRTFTEEQEIEGRKVIGLQAGSNKGATQSGQNFGLGRQIL